MSNKTTTTTCTYFPPELLTDIISRLPVKTILRLRCVCRLWCSFINDSTFISMHRDCTTINNNSYIIDTESNHFEFYFLHCDKKFIVHEKLSNPINFEPKYAAQYIVGSCNGLLCITNSYNTYLWNPSIRRFKALPCCPVDPLFNIKLNVILGFGFCQKSNDYKVVRISFGDKYSSEPSKPFLVEVYTLSTNSWKRISTDICCLPRFNYYQNAYMNGVNHWMAWKDTRTYDDLILSFDFADEVFQEIMLPNSFPEEYKFEGYLGIFKECISLFDVPNYATMGPYRHDLWVMKEYGVVESWVKLYTFELQQIIGLPIAFGYDGELLLEEERKEVLMSFDMETKQFKNLGIHQFFDLVTYKESLVLLDGEMVSEGEQNNMQ